MKALKKTISLVLCLCLIASFTVAAFAADGKKTDYPFIYVHGMYGWGEDAEKEITRPYWGTQPENNIIPYLRSLGYTVYNPSVSGFSSAWDRACELFAQLTGSVVDYGAAHSKECGCSVIMRGSNGTSALRRK